AVSPAIIPLTNLTGIKWLVTDQAQLGKIVPELSQFDPTNVSVLQEHLLYQPYLIRDEKTGKETVTVYRNLDFSDDIGFRFSGRDPNEAAASFVDKFKSIYDRFNESSDTEIKNKPHLVTVALDGENAWENYQYNGQFTANQFLKQVYTNLQTAQNEGWLKTITPSQYLDSFGYSNLNQITVKENEWVGSWQEGRLDTWIGEKEENVNWDRLAEARNALIQAEIDDPAGNFSEAWKILYQAEGSDWFWWAGDDWNSGTDERFDWIFKLLLRGVYQNIGLTDQEILNKYPYIFAKLKGPISSNVNDFLNPTIDGIAQLGEWENAAHFNDSEVDSQNMIDSIYAGYDEEGETFFIRIDPSQNINTNDFGFAIYFTSPGVDEFNVFPRYTPNSVTSQSLGIEINFEIAINISNSAIVLCSLFQAGGNQSWTFIKNIQQISFNDNIEISIPFSDLNISPTDAFQFNIIAANGTPYLTRDIAPNNGPWGFSAPTGSISGKIVFEIFDEEGDDTKNNPNNGGSKSDLLYPTNSIFNPGYGHFDLLRYTVAEDFSNNNVIFQMEFSRLIVNLGWNTPTFTLPYTQIYVDTDNILGSGRTDTIENARVAIEEKHAWDFMVNIEGEVDFQYVLFSNGTKIKSGVQAVGDLIIKTVTALVSQNIIGVPTKDWNYAVIVGSKDYHGFRNINADPQEWIGGGGADGSYDPNVYDMLTPKGKNQKDLLSKFSELEQKYADVFMVGPTIVYEKDTIPPNITISSPSENQIFSGSGSEINIDIVFNAFDNVEIVIYQVFLNQFLVESIRDTGLSTISIVWYSNGDYDLRVNVFDDENNFGSDIVSITITGLTELEDNPFFNESFPMYEDQPGINGWEAIYLISSLFLFSIILISRRRVKI
ncbi:MAG: glucodextranase DOMON-like domain-containing protein, partial [Candidatus Kariarchaeaceae archaeon]